VSTPYNPASGTAPSCYRHPGRETYVTCNRCQRYVCPECMRSAAVGHQCVDCVNEGARTVRQPATALGGRLTTRPVVTYVLIAINVAMFVVQTAAPEFEKQFFLWPNGVAHYDQFYRLLTSGFLHAGITHIAFNMIALYFTGPAVEHALGHARFLALYVLSLLGGSVLVYLLTPVGTPTLGASGAIFGLFGASFVLARKLQFDIRGIVGLIVINLVITFVAPGISWQGHIGGLLTGAAVAGAFAYAPRANRTLVQAGCSVAMLAVFAALVWWRTAAIVTGVG
jgi:membrane associated rhomboid family serine protease